MSDMRALTDEERKRVNESLRKLSTPTGVRLNDPGFVRCEVCDKIVSKEKADHDFEPNNRYLNLQPHFICHECKANLDHPRCTSCGHFVSREKAITHFTPDSALTIEQTEIYCKTCYDRIQSVIQRYTPKRDFSDYWLSMEQATAALADLEQHHADDTYADGFRCLYTQIIAMQELLHEFYDAININWEDVRSTPGLSALMDKAKKIMRLKE